MAWEQLLDMPVWFERLEASAIGLGAAKFGQETPEFVWEQRFGPEEQNYLVQGAAAFRIDPVQ